MLVSIANSLNNKNSLLGATKNCKKQFFAQEMQKAFLCISRLKPAVLRSSLNREFLNIKLRTKVRGFKPCAISYKKRGHFKICDLKFNLPKNLNKMDFLVFNKMENLKNIIGIFLVLSVILIAGCSTSEQEDNTQDYNNDFVPDNNGVDNIPTESTTSNVVATVNNEEIKSEDVAAVQQSLLQQGQQISEDDALEQVINQKVLEQKVQQENIVVTTDEAESVIEQQLAMQGATLDDYKQQVESMGVSYEAELENIKNQIATQQFLESQLEGQTFDVTEEEAQEFYEMYKAQSPEEVPSYEELQPQIITTLEQQKQQEAISIIIQGLRATANVEYK
jgi:hypothetical protein